VSASEPNLIRRSQQPPALPRSPAPRARPWQNYLLALACIGAIVAAYELVGPSTSSSSTEIRLVTVARGVVQASESASGNLAPVSESDLNFKSSGILTGLYVQPGQYVHQGQLLAEIDSSSASVALQEAEASLEAAQAKLAATRADPSGSSSVGGSSNGAQASAAAYIGTTGASGTSGSSGASGSSGTSGVSGAVGSASPSTTKPAAAKSSSTSTSTDSAVTQATDAANIASAEAAVSSAELTVKSDKAALAGTKLYAPSAGTIASVSGAVGDEVTAGTGAGSSADSSGSNGSSGSGAASAFSSSSSSDASSSSASSSSGSGFIVLANLSAMQLVVSVSESDIGSIKVGQPATISVDALPSEEFAAKVTAISLLSSSSSGVVSYSVTIKLTQNSSQLKPGMTATATIITGQVNDALNVESAAISSRGTGSTVTVDKNGKMVVTPVITGLVGASSTQIVAGVTAGEELAIPISTSIATSTTTTGSGTLGASSSGGFGGAALSGLGGGGGGFGRFSRGG
jgi:multidrug efflux pump subunit AcrA (membrane-fusion protein)